MMAPKNKGVFPGDAGYSNLVYYVCPWNDEYCVYSSSHIQRHSNIKWVYNTKDKIVMETSKKDFLSLIKKINNYMKL